MLWTHILLLPAFFGFSAARYDGAANTPPKALKAFGLGFLCEFENARNSEPQVRPLYESDIQLAHRVRRPLRLFRGKSMKPRRAAWPRSKLRKGWSLPVKSFPGPLSLSLR